MGFSGYFLIVQDFINWAKEHGIPVGPGRGSGAGSLVAYALRITDLDPIPYNLLFERFLNPERVSMPDFDVDFCHEPARRGDQVRHARSTARTTSGRSSPSASLKAQERHARRRPGVGAAVRRGRQDRQAGARAGITGKAPTIDEALGGREPTAARARRRREGSVQGAARDRARARGPAPPGRHARRRRGHRRQAALGVRARLARPRRAKSSPSSPRTRSRRPAW